MPSRTPLTLLPDWLEAAGKPPVDAIPAVVAQAVQNHVAYDLLQPDTDDSAADGTVRDRLPDAVTNAVAHIGARDLLPKLDAGKVAGDGAALCLENLLVGIAGQPLSGNLLTLGPSHGAVPPIRALIDWGDETELDDGVIVAGPDGSFEIHGSHIYDEAGAYAVNVAVAYADETRTTHNTLAVIQPAVSGPPDSPSNLQSGSTNTLPTTPTAGSDTPTSGGSAYSPPVVEAKGDTPATGQPTGQGEKSPTSGVPAGLSPILLAELPAQSDALAALRSAGRQPTVTDVPHQLEWSPGPDYQAPRTADVPLHLHTGNGSFLLPPAEEPPESVPGADAGVVAAAAVPPTSEAERESRRLLDRYVQWRAAGRSSRKEDATETVVATAAEEVRKLPEDAGPTGERLVVRAGMFEAREPHEESALLLTARWLFLPGAAWLLARAFSPPPAKARSIAETANETAAATSPWPSVEEETGQIEPEFAEPVPEPVEVP